MFQLSCEKHCQPKNQGLTTKFNQEFIQVTPKAQLQLPSVGKDQNYLLNTEYFFTLQTRIWVTENEGFKTSID